MIQPIVAKQDAHFPSPFVLIKIELIEMNLETYLGPYEYFRRYMQEMSGGVWSQCWHTQGLGFVLTEWVNNSSWILFVPELDVGDSEVVVRWCRVEVDAGGKWTYISYEHSRGR